MKLKSIHLSNFRCYKDPISIEFGNITTLIGKNDIGKSTILEALEIFFNNEVVKIDSSDANIHGGKEVIIECDFCELPESIILDSGESTNLEEEYLVYAEDTIRIKKVYDCSKNKVTPIVYIVANHPTAKGVNDLLSLKEKDLQKIIKDSNIEAPLKGNPKMRKAIWASSDDLQLSISEIEVSKAKEEGKEIWSKIESYLPTYALFQSDRSSQDSDTEVQNPMKVAIQEAISEVQNEIVEIQKKVQEKALNIATQTQKALKEIDENLANQLTPKFSAPSSTKWNSLFSIAMDTDEGISLNKRGSGVRRMILVGFFKAEAERKASRSNKKDIIYAIEEPETAQHPNNQKILINSFMGLSEVPHCQVLLTTHSPSLAKELPTQSLRFINRDDKGIPVISEGEGIIKDIVETLGIQPNPENKIKVVLCLEGPTDVIAFYSFSRCLRERYPDVIDLSSDNRVLVVPLGGSILKYWVERNYLSKLNCPEIHIYDNDVEHYQNTVDEVNNRKNGSWATLTQKREIENYLHKDAIKSVLGVAVDTDLDGVPSLVAEAYYNAHKDKLDHKWKDKTSKIQLSKVFEQAMNYELLALRDPEGEIKRWFDRIYQLVNL